MADTARVRPTGASGYMAAPLNTALSVAGTVRGSAGTTLVAALALAATAHAAPPANDDFAGAQQLSPASGVPASASGTNVEATTEPGEPTHGGPGGPSVWYRWTPTVSGPVEVDTCGSNFDTLLAVYTGTSLGSLDQVGSNDQSPTCPGANQSTVSFSATAGQLYRFAVDGYFGDTGQIVLRVGGPPPTISVADTTVTEGTGGISTASFTVSLSRPASGPVRVVYQTFDGSARAGADYGFSSSTLTFAPGETVRQVPIAVFGDTLFESRESFGLGLSNPENATLARGFATGTIEDDDLPQIPGDLFPGDEDEGDGGDEDEDGDPFDGPVKFSSSGEESEIVKTIPITKKGKGRTVMRVGPKELGPIEPGDAIESSAEVEASVTCLEKLPKCVGSIYHYSPFVRGKLVLSGTGKKAKSVQVSRTESLRCSQNLPHRNHHCVLVVPPVRKDLAKPPCSECNLDLVLSASDRRAGKGDKLVIGSDGDHGVEQDKGRINAIVLSPGAAKPVTVTQSQPSPGSAAVAGRGQKPIKKIIISAKLDDLRRGEQIFIEAQGYLKTDHLPYGTFVGSHTVLSEKPDSDDNAGLPSHNATFSGQFTEKNGFNCTRGRSAHTSPCLVHEVGAVQMLESVDKPLYVNVVVELAAQFGGRHQNSDQAKILNRGSLRVERYPPSDG